MASAAKAMCARTVKRGRTAPIDLVACVLHELRIPLTAILSAGENVRDGLPADKDRLREEGTIIVNQAMRLMNLGDQILVYASTGKPRCDMRALTAAEIIDDALENTATLLQQANVTLERKIQPGLPVVRGDLSLLSQCLQNLISNAVKYGGQNRWVGISTLLGADFSTGQKEIQIAVRDRGVGVSPQDLPHIFEPFYRSRRPAVSKIRGSGLGLFIAQTCAETCGGALSVVSEEGVGCVFTLHLPLHRAFETRLATPKVRAGGRW